MILHLESDHPRPSSRVPIRDRVSHEPRVTKAEFGRNYKNTTVKFNKAFFYSYFTAPSASRQKNHLARTTHTVQPLHGHAAVHAVTVTVTVTVKKNAAAKRKPTTTPNESTHGYTKSNAMRDFPKSRATEKRQRAPRLIVGATALNSTTLTSHCTF